jgi:hypothetical protein
MLYYPLMSGLVKKKRCAFHLKQFKRKENTR